MPSIKWVSSTYQSTCIIWFVELLFYAFIAEFIQTKFKVESISKAVGKFIATKYIDDKKN